MRSPRNSSPVAASNERPECARPECAASVASVGAAERQVSACGPAIHPAIAPAAFGLLGLGSALDMVARSGALTWLSYYALAGGVALGTWCAVFALLDWICFADLGRSGIWGLDVIPTAVVVGLYCGAVLLRVDSPWHAATASSMALEVAGAGLLANKAWIGRELAVSLAIRR
jgi:hypothetical protein